MRRLRLVLAVLAAAAIATGCKEPLPPLPPVFPLTVTFVAPYDGQMDVPTSTRVWIRASEALTAAQASSTLRLETDTGEVVNCGVQLSEDSQAAVLAPSAPLQPGREYQVLFLRDADHGGNLVVSRFATRPAGTRSQDGFQVVSFYPMDVPALSVWPFTTFRVLLSEPASPDTTLDGSQPDVRLVRVSTQEIVPAQVILRGSTIVLDPSVDLEAGEDYRLELTSGILDLAGQALTPTSMVVSVKALAPMRQLSLALGPTPTTSGTPLGSRLEAKAPNTLELRSSLVGANTLSLEGALDAELPDPGQIGARLPMVIRKGQVLTVRGPDNGGLAIKLGGAIGTNLNSGPLSMTLLTDASGEISENPLRPEAPGARPLVRLSMDAALTAQDSTVNTMLTQDLLGLQLVGSLYVEGEGRLGVELVGGVELDLMGLDTGASSVTIGAWSAEKQPPVGPGPMEVRLVSPANDDMDVELDRPVQVVFTQPPDSSARAGVWLEHAPGDGAQGTGDDVAASLKIEGSLVLLRSRTPLAMGTQYVVRVAQGIQSVAGAMLALPASATFQTGMTNPSNPRPTAVASISPGVPCAFFDGGTTRQCSPTSPSSGPFTLGSNSPVEAYFTKPVNMASLRLGQTVVVVDADGGTPVAGHLTAGADWMKFIPDQPWQVGHPYVLTLGGASDAGCGQGALCDTTGRVVNTDLLLDNVQETEGGPPIQLPFSGAAPSGPGGLSLRLSPVTDTNANGFIEVTSPAETLRLENSVTLRDSRDGSFWDRTYVFGTLIAEVGRFNPVTNELPLIIDEGSWLYGTEINLAVLTDRLVIQPASRQAGALSAAPSSDNDQRPILTIPMDLYMHSVSRNVEPALPRTPLHLTLVGRVDFTPDGRMTATVRNIDPASLTILNGGFTFLIDVGDVQVRASSGVLGR
jgi:hypothetical protein